MRESVYLRYISKSTSGVQLMLSVTGFTLEFDQEFLHGVPFAIHSPEASFTFSFWEFVRQLRKERGSLELKLCNVELIAGRWCIDGTRCCRGLREGRRRFVERSRFRFGETFVTFTRDDGRVRGWTFYPEMPVVGFWGAGCVSCVR